LGRVSGQAGEKGHRDSNKFVMKIYIIWHSGGQNRNGDKPQKKKVLRSLARGTFRCVQNK